MAEREPVTEIDTGFSTPGAPAVAWEVGRAAFAAAEIYWLSTVRPDGRPHVSPLLGIWLDGAVYFSTGPSERKAHNLAENAQCVMTTGNPTLDGLDLVVEGSADLVTDPPHLARIAETYVAKYGVYFAPPDGIWADLGDAIRDGGVLVYRVAPTTAFGFGKGEQFTQTRWTFS